MPFRCFSNASHFHVFDAFDYHAPGPGQADMCFTLSRIGAQVRYLRISAVLTASVCRIGTQVTCLKMAAIAIGR